MVPGAMVHLANPVGSQGPRQTVACPHLPRQRRPSRRRFPRRGGPYRIGRIRQRLPRRQHTEHLRTQVSQAKNRKEDTYVYQA